MKNKDQVILITGASSGFGRGLAEELHRLGYKVYGTSRNPDKHDVIFNLIKADVQEDNSVKSAVTQVIDKEGKIDVLINNAGVLTIGPLEETSDAEAHSIFETNFFGVLRMTKAVLPLMRERKNGRIINISSLAGQVPTPGMGMYCASKHALEGYSKTLRLEVESLGIDVTLVEPGEYKTAVLSNASYADQKINYCRHCICRRQSPRYEGDSGPAC